MPTSFSAGRVLSRSFSILLANAGAFVLMTLLVNLPLIFFDIYEALSLPRVLDLQQRFLSWALISGIAGLAIQPIATAAVTYGVFQHLRGKPASFGACFRFGLSRMLPVLGVILVTVLAIVVGMMACLVPGIILMCILFVAVPAAVVEGTGVDGSIRRSSDLTRGFRWSIFGIFLILLLINIGLGQLFKVTTFDPKSADLRGFQIYILGSGFLTVIGQSLQAVVSSVTYHDLRVEREGLTTSDLAAVFD